MITSNALLFPVFFFLTSSESRSNPDLIQALPRPSSESFGGNLNFTKGFPPPSHYSLFLSRAFLPIYKEIYFCPIAGFFLVIFAYLPLTGYYQDL